MGFVNNSRKSSIYHLRSRQAQEAPDTLEPPFSASSSLTPINHQPTPDQSKGRSHTSIVPLLSDCHDLLPTAHYTEAGGVIACTPEDDMSMFLHHDLDVTRLNYIHKRLWMAGRSWNYYALHRQKMMKREVVLTEQADLHLTWSASTVFVKPFPQYLGHHDFWTAHLCHQKELHGAACGFLYSYTWLISHESDFAIAQSLNLIPRMQWTQWRAYIQDVRRTIDRKPPEYINRRYQFGELRLRRLNWLYRFFGRPQDRSLIRGYFYNYRTYSSFFVRRFAWLFAVFAYVTIVLTAMQVGLATQRLQPSQSFQDASYGFVVFSIAAPLIAVVTAAVTFFIALLYNLADTLSTRRHQEKKTFVQGKIRIPSIGDA